MISIHNTKKQDRFLLYIITFIILTFICLTIIGTNISNIIPKLHSVTEYNKGWTDTVGNPSSLNKFKSTQSQTKESHFIYHKIAASSQDQTLIFRARNMFIKVYHDDKLFYEEDMDISPFFGSTKGSEWHIITLPAHSDEFTLSIECITVYENTHGLIDNIYLGPVNDVIKRVIVNHIFGFMICNVILFVSVAIILVYLYLHYKNVNERSILFLGITVFFAALWSSMETLLWQFFCGTAELSHLLSYLSLLIIPIPLCLMGYDKLHGHQKFFCKVFYYICIINFVITSCLHFSGILEFHYTMYPTYILIFIMVVVAFMLTFHFIKRTHNLNNSKVLIFGVVLISGSAILEIVRYLYGSYGNYSSITRIGILIVVICFTILYTNKLLDILRQSTQAEMIRQVALTDAMTKLFNRTALTEDSILYEELLQKHTTLGVLEFDVNNLKPVNDIYGHEKGDQLLIAASTCIQKAFSQVGKCYRTGGDEFLVIFSGTNPVKDYEISLQVFEKERNLHNQSAPPELYLDIAHGFIADTDRPLKAIIKSADALMYDNKRILKKQV